jgi:mannose/cellobiose epimerase-like protein (N-acyl-D-glucosamine 2-epimerase family)
MAWLIPESVKVIGDEAYDKMAAECSEGLLNQIMTVALDNENGGIFESETDGTVSTDKVWWVECEAVNAFLYAFQKTGDDKYFELAENTWNFCKNHLIKPDGIWYWSTDKFGNINPRPEKPSPIPDAYHTCRTCVRGIEVLNSLVKI